MQPLLVTFASVAAEDVVYYSHEGEECVFLLDGELEFRTPDQTRSMKRGDCLYFDSDVAHAFRSLGERPARALVIVYTKDGSAV